MEFAMQHGTPIGCRTTQPLKLIGWAALLVGGLTAGVMAVTPLPLGNARYDDASANIFIEDELTIVDVTMSPADLNDLLANPFQDTYKVCSVHVQNSKINETIGNVGIRCRGNTSRTALKKSWKLSFNEFEQGRRFHGLKKFNINGEHNDAAITRSRLSMETYRKFNVPAPRASHVRFKINDGADVEDVHVNIEQVNDDFVDAWFGSNTGNLFKCTYQGSRADLRYISPGTPETYQSLGDSSGPTYELEINDEAPNYTDLADFIAFINNTTDPVFAAGIQDRMNVDNFLRAMAVDVANGNWDNYWYGANNFYLYHNPDNNRFEYIPYDTDNTYGIDFFGIDWANRGYSNWGSGGFGSDGGDQPPLARRIMAIPAFEAQYRRYLRQIVGAVGTPTNPSQSYTDTVGDVATAPEPNGPHYDIASVVMSNDANNVYINVQLNGPLDVGGDTGNGEYLVLFNTRSGGSTSNAWGRSINATVQHDFFIGSWPDAGGGIQFWERQGTQWQQRSGASIDLANKGTGLIKYTVPISGLETSIGTVITFDVVSTGGGGDDSGVDHLSNPNPSTTSFSIPSTPGTYKSYTLQNASAPASVETFFTLPMRQATIDAIRTRLTPYAFTGSYSGSSMDWGFTNATFLGAYNSPSSYANNHPLDWGVKPYIAARTASLRAGVPAPAALPAVRVNEIMAYNCSNNQDPAGDFDDWVELYNTGATVLDVGGMFLSDDPSVARKWLIPAGTTIPSHGFLLIWCDNEPAEGPLHATFSLGVSGETVALFDTDAKGNVLVDYLSYATLQGDIAYGRFPDGADAAELLTNATPGAANDNSGGPPPPPAPMPALFINEWMADNDATILDPDEPGSYEDYIEIYNAEDFSVDLAGMHLTDNLTNPTKWQIPAGVTIGPKSYLLFWADSEPAQGPRHTSFGLSKSGEAIGLFGSRADCLAQIDAITFGAQTTNIAQGRYADGKSCIKTLRVPSPGAGNMVLAGDADDDGDVDLADYAKFAECFGGPDGTTPVTCGACVDADFDGDGDTDLADFARVQSH
jgi:spore coat protein CotH